MVAPPTAPVTSLFPSRAELRAILRARRQAFFAENQPVFPIAHTLLDLLKGYRCVGGYAPLRHEPDVLPLLAARAGDDVTIALPHFAGRDAAMHFRRWRSGDALETSPFRFQQPLASSDDVTPDVLLIPLLGFDRAGNRLGQGAGHYDRYLADHPHVLKVGIAWSVQECDVILAESWDVPLDVIATQEDLIKCPEK